MTTSSFSDAEAAALEAAARGDEVPLALAVARRYHFGEQSKVEIARALGISRFQVARLLADGRRDGLVRIEIGAPGRVDAELSAGVAGAYGLERVVVVEADPSSARGTTRVLGRALAAELSSLVADGARLGLAWSRAVADMSQELRRLRPCTVVQLGGAVSPPEGYAGSVEVVRAVAATAGGQAHCLYAPLVVPDAATSSGLQRQPEVAAALAQAVDLDVAVLAIGAWRTAASAVHDLLPLDEQQRLRDLGVVGEVCGRLFDGSGAAVTALDDRVIGAPLERLRGARRTVVSASGAHRAEAARAVLRSGLAPTLVVDDELARALLAPAAPA